MTWISTPFLLVTTLWLLGISSAATVLESNDIPTVEKMFRQYIDSFHKIYAVGSTEYLKRLRIFKESLKRISFLNKSEKNTVMATYGLTSFSDMTPDEFSARLLRTSSNKRVKKRLASEASGVDLSLLPRRVDWRDRKVVNKVGNQEDCGACWAYSITETTESMLAIKSGKFLELSIQQLIDCVKGYNYGCEGGDTCSALAWMVKNKLQFVTEEQYPLENKARKCRQPNITTGFRVADNYTCYNYTGKEDRIMWALAKHGPVVAAVDATGWQDYLGGIIQYNCERNRNHAVQIVGYDSTGDVPYYIVRNSWGKNFGINGYLHIAIGKDLCAIAEEVSEIDVVA